MEARYPTCQASSLLADPPGKPKNAEVSSQPIPSPGDLPTPGRDVRLYKIIEMTLLCFIFNSLISWITLMDFQIFNQCSILGRTKINRLCCAYFEYIGLVCASLLLSHQVHKFLLLPCLICHLFNLLCLSSDTIILTSTRWNWVWFMIFMSLLNFITYETQYFQEFYYLCLQFLKSLPLLCQFDLSRGL